MLLRIGALPISISGALPVWHDHHDAFGNSGRMWRRREAAWRGRFNIITAPVSGGPARTLKCGNPLCIDKI
jgi:hypothetical protein